MNVSQSDSPPKTIVITTTNLQWIIRFLTRSINVLKKDKKQNFAVYSTNQEVSVYACNSRIVNTVSLARSEMGNGSDIISPKSSCSNK